eukprot:Sdes_comp20399_c0_seq11m14369
MKSLNVLLAGASGFLGTELRKKLLQKGHTVLCVSRQKSKPNLSWEDLSKNGLPDHIDCVVNLSGANIMSPYRPWTKAFQKEVYDSRINTTRILRDLCVAQHNKKTPLTFVSASGLSCYPCDGSIYSENFIFSHLPTSFLSHLQFKWEEAASMEPQAHNQHPRSVIIRIGLVLGNQGGALQAMLPSFKLGLGASLGSGQQPFPWVHIDDLTGIFLKAIETPEMKGIFNAVAPSIITNSEFSQALASKLNRPCVLSVPSLVLRSIYGNDRASLLLDGPKVWPESTQKAGYKFKHDTIHQALDKIFPTS